MDPTNVNRQSVDQWRVFRVELSGEAGWFDDGKVTLRPGEPVEAERARIQAYENVPCRLIPVP